MADREFGLGEQNGPSMRCRAAGVSWAVEQRRPGWAIASGSGAVRSV